MKTTATQEHYRLVSHQLDEGIDPQQIAAEYGITTAMCYEWQRRYRRDLSGARSRASQQRREKNYGECRSSRKAAGIEAASGTKAEADALRLMDAIPLDTRDVTAFVLGDPLPGRSALDRRRMANG